MERHLRRLLLVGVTLLPGILPVSCERDVLQTLTPFLIDGGNRLLIDVIFAAAPFVLP